MQVIWCLKFCNMTKSGGQSPRSKFWGTCPPIPPVIYAHGPTAQKSLSCKTDTVGMNRWNASIVNSTGNLSSLKSLISAPFQSSAACSVLHVYFYSTHYYSAVKSYLQRKQRSRIIHDTVGISPVREINLNPYAPLIETQIIRHTCGVEP